MLSPRDTELNVNLRCPGRYCGVYLELNNETCGACPAGFRRRTVGDPLCSPCNGQPSLYDWLYLGFMALLPIVFHWIAIGACVAKRMSSIRVIFFYICSLIECCLAIIITLLVLEPFGSLSLRSCPVSQLSDWYTLLHNPSIDYQYTLHCAQEAVYPLYSAVCIYYAIALLVMIIVRPIVAKFIALVAKGIHRFRRKPNATGVVAVVTSLSVCNRAFYAALYFYPALIAIHAIAAGLLYYAFPYVIVLGSLISNAIHLSGAVPESNEMAIMEYARGLFGKPRNVCLILGHWILNAYAIVSLTELTKPALHIPLLALTPVPFLFYLGTMRFTNPEHVKMHIPRIQR